MENEITFATDGVYFVACKGADNPRYSATQAERNRKPVEATVIVTVNTEKRIYTVGCPFMEKGSGGCGCLNGRELNEANLYTAPTCSYAVPAVIEG